MESGSFRVRASHALWAAFPDRSAMRRFSQNSTGHPHAALQPRLSAVWALPRSLAATCGISIDFFSRATQMVHFAQYCPAALSSFARTVHASQRAGYPIRLPADLRMLAPPRGLSRLAAAFLAVQLL